MRAAILDGDLDADDAPMAFERGLAEGALEERGLATGLKDFDARAHERTIDRFSARASQVRELLKRDLAAGVLGSRQVSTSATSGRMGELRRQLTRQRGGLTVRKLMEGYADLITQIMPCTLVSPDSVARFFPARADLFDIVVFDEASQIRVADAVGAMGRGASVVVVGDSKQMPPTSFAESSGDAFDDLESEVSPVEDMESILSECVEARVPRQWLSWHYRSQDESLIAFSNQQYYESKLSSFPGPSHSAPDAGIRGHGVNFKRVDGYFHRTGTSKVLRTNPIEAEAVVAEVRRRFDIDGHLTVNRSSHVQPATARFDRVATSRYRTTHASFRLWTKTLRDCSSRIWRTFRVTSETSYFSPRALARTIKAICH